MGSVFRPHPIVPVFGIDMVYTAFRLSFGGDYVFDGESHDFWEIVFVLSGKVVSTQDEKVYLLERNDLIVHAPMQFHSLRGTDGCDSEVLIISFHANGELPSALNRGIFALSPENALAYQQICDRLIALLDGGSETPYDDQEIISRLTAFLIRLSRQDADCRLIVSADVLVYRDIISAMHANVCENLTLEDFARSCNISVSYLKLLFKKYAAISPKNYFADLRVQHAIKLMQQGMSTSAIANIMNFSSPNYFSVFFKKHTGEVPSVYRKHL